MIVERCESTYALLQIVIRGTSFEVEQREHVRSRPFPLRVGDNFIRVVPRRCRIEENQMGEVLRVAQRIVERNVPAEGMADHRDLIDAEVLSKTVRVIGELLEGERREERPSRPTVAAMIVIDESKYVAQRIEPRMEQGMIEPTAAVHHQARPASAHFEIEQLRPIDVGKRHGERFFGYSRGRHENTKLTQPIQALSVAATRRSRVAAFDRWSCSITARA